MTKYQVGDEIELGGRFKITRVDEKDPRLPISIQVSGEVIFPWIHPSMISAHHPKAHEFKPGDTVYCRETLCELVSLKGDDAVLYRGGDNSYAFVAPVSELTPADGWIPWNGGECPVPHGPRVQIRFRDGSVLTNELPYNYTWSYVQRDPGRNIVAYRVLS